ncbi:MAG: TetR family transcriptional regulator [Thalassobius sp.]|nr:TetR family transcriptional regulator [Thalassovita sp.]
MEKQSTEEKIKAAARKLFIEKGFAATKTRDIAEEADINIALMNYYFKSKEKLFDAILEEAFQYFPGKLISILEEEISIEEKVTKFVTTHSEMLKSNPLVPIFVLSELRNNPQKFVEKIGMHEILTDGVLVNQLREESAKGNIKKISPIHFLINMISLTVFPFIIQPALLTLENLNTDIFNNLIDERKQMIPEILMNQIRI